MDNLKNILQDIYNILKLDGIKDFDLLRHMFVFNGCRYLKVPICKKFNIPL